MGGGFSCMCDVDAEGNIDEKVKGAVKLKVELKNENKTDKNKDTKAKEDVNENKE